MSLSTRCLGSVVPLASFFSKLVVSDNFCSSALYKANVNTDTDI